MSNLILNESINFDVVTFYNKPTNTVLKVDNANKCYKKARMSKSVKQDCCEVSLSALKEIVQILKLNNYTNCITKNIEISTDSEENMEITEMLIKTKRQNLELTEARIDDLNMQDAKDYQGEKLYRVVGFFNANGRTQMWTIGLGARIRGDEESDTSDGENYFKPKVRSARYTTEESLVFTDKHEADKFFAKFKLDYADEETLSIKKFYVTQYNPFHEILKLIPVSTPIGDAYVTEQKFEKKKYDSED